MTLELIPRNQLSPELWNKFVASHPSAWFWHTSHWLDYSRHHAAWRDGEEHSFAVFDGNRLAGVVPLLIETRDGIRQARMDQWGLPNPLFNPEGLNPRRQRSWIRRLYSLLVEQAHRHHADVLLVRSTPMTPFLHPSRYYPPEAFPELYGFFPMPNYEQILHLKDRTLTEIIDHADKGHRATMRKFLANHPVEIIDSTFPADEIDHAFARYRQTHFRDAGRQTRPDETWACQCQWIHQGHAILAQYRTEELEAYALVNIWQRTAYYQSAATWPEIKAGNTLGPILQLAILRWLIEHGIHYYSLSEYFPGPIPAFPDDNPKYYAISNFKHHFGAEPVMVPQGIRFLSATGLDYGRQLLQKVSEGLQYYGAPTAGLNHDEN